MRGVIVSVSVFSFLLSACGDGHLVAAEELTQNVSDLIVLDSLEESAILALVNDPEVDYSLLDNEVGLDRRAAANIIADRDGTDAVPGSADDDLFDDIDELDAVPYVGDSALKRLLAYAVAHGYMPGSEEFSQEELDYVALALANDLAVSESQFDQEVGLDSRAAANIVAFRNGPDQISGTLDDRVFMTIEQLDSIKYIGAGALASLSNYAITQGYLEHIPTGQADVIFSPQAHHQSHNARVIELINSAQITLDIAMYGLSDGSVFNALRDAANRGTKIRLIFQTARADAKKTGSDLTNSRSARLEKMGINVRYVNKIMHHKFMIVDGPRDSLIAAQTATLVTGSGNWSYGAATKYDENTLFLDGYPELVLRMQQEFNLLWEHSRDFVYDDSLPYELSTVVIDNTNLVDDPATHAVYTSDNFSVSGDTFRIITGRNTVSDVLVSAIKHATDSIWVASGHLRSRPVAEALMKKAQTYPDMDIRVYLDGQEYISTWYHDKQLRKLEDCLVAAGSSQSKIRKCYDKGFLFGYQVGESGVAVRYKYYAYRWHYSYALQMHHKLIIIDGDELYTGSYNLSDNAEHNTFENMLVFRGLPFARLINQYQGNFLSIWNTARDDGDYQALLDEINTAPEIPLVFAPMAIDWDEIAELKSAIRENCPSVNSEEYSSEPEEHLECYR